MDKALPSTSNQLTTNSDLDYAKRLRNADDYDDWDVGLEPIPFDCTWAAWLEKS